MNKKAVLIAVAAGILASTTVFGHAKLLYTSPVADAEVHVAPKVLLLEFNENVKLAVLRLTGAGGDIPVSIDRGAAAARRVAVPLPMLAAGKYQVLWSALSPDDGHVVKGVFSFVIAGPNEVPSGS